MAFRLEIVNEYSGTNLPSVWEFETFDEAKKKIVDLVQIDGYLEVGDVIKIKEV